MIFRYILSCISLITLVNFHADIAAARLFHATARNAQAPQMQRCAMCKQQKPVQECTATKFSVYCRICLLASGIEVPPTTQSVDVAAPTAPQQFNRTAVVLYAALVTAGTYCIVRKIRNKFKQSAHNTQTQDTKVKQNEL